MQTSTHPLGADSRPGNAAGEDANIGGTLTFVASPRLVADLQRAAVDLIELHLQARQAHWNVTGAGVRSLHLQLDQIADDARGFSDAIAERVRAVHGVPDGRSVTVAATTSLPLYPAGEQSTATAALITRRLERAAHTLRVVHDEVDAEDPTSADILHTTIQALEKHAWMVGSENRSPAPIR